MRRTDPPGKLNPKAPAELLRFAFLIGKWRCEARVLVDGKWMWVTYAGGACRLTNNRERFLDLNHYSAEMFYAWLWRSPPPANASLPAMSFKDSISIKEAAIW